MTAARIILAGGVQQIGAVFWAALAVALLALLAAGVFFVLFFKGRARWQAIRGEVGDDTLAMLARPAQAAPWPDGDTFCADGLADELARMLKEGDGRG